MFVRLVVVENRDRKNGWRVCTGGSCYVKFDESFQGDDVHGSNYEKDPTKEEIEKWTPEQAKAYIDKSQTRPYEKFHFPLIDVTNRKGLNWNSEPHDERVLADRKYNSIPYLAIINMGSTGWSGFDSEKEDYWICSYKDLTDEGKSLYNTVKKLYGKFADVYLTTWLDT
jgi:hypothetical protein